MLAALLAGVLAQSPTLAVLTLRRTGGATVAEGVSVARDVGAQLQREGFVLKLPVDAAVAALGELGVKDTAVCEGRKLCVGEFGRQLGATVMVSVSLARLGSELGVNVEALRSSDGLLLGTTSFSLARGAGVQSADVSGLAEALRAALGVKPRATDAPKQAVLLPQPAPAPVAVVAAPERSHTAGMVLLGAAAAAVVAGAMLAGLALSTNGELQRRDASGASVHSLSEANGLAAQTNALATAAIGVGAGAVLLGAGAVVAW